MKYTLLELVQRILQSMESDEVSSIDETPESQAVADIIKECYFDIVGHGNFSEQIGPFKLDASGDNTKPVLMTIPSDVIRVDWLKYDISSDLTKPDYKPLMFRPQEEFFYVMSSLDPDDSDISSMSVSIDDRDYTLRFYTDRMPSYYTIFDESSVIFDAYDSDTEDTLTNSRSLGFGLLSVDFSMENSFVPDLDPRQFQLLLQDAKSTAFIELKQTTNPKAEQKYRRNLIHSQRTKNDNNPNTSRQKTYKFGRRPR